MFLQGSGKLALMVPFMGSLLTRTSEAAGVIKPRFIFMSAQNGGQRHEQWFPLTSPTTSMPLYTSHNYHMDPISFNASTGISPIFDSKFNSFISKMNFIKGLDQRFSSFGNHNGAPLLGNVRAAHSTMGFCPSIATIDQLMAYSNNFYPNNGDGYVRSISINPNANTRHSGYYFSNPTTKTGSIVYVPSVQTANAIFRALFDNTSATAVPMGNTPLVDGVLDDYKRIRNSRELSSTEKTKLDEYIDKLAQLEIKLTTDVVPNIPQCRNLVAPPTSGGNEIQNIDLILDMIILAFQCDRSRIATIHFNKVNGRGEGGSMTVGDWHWASHNTTDPLGMQINLDIYKWIADNALYPLINKMNAVVESNGLTMLDNSIVHFATASAHSAHNPKNLPTLLFGSAGGFLKTGNYIDYVNRGATSFGKPAEYGILHNQYLTNIMTAMGLNKSDWNMKNLGFTKNGFPTNAEGYGWYTNVDGSSGNDPRYSKSESQINNPLPGLISASGLTKFV